MVTYLKLGEKGIWYRGYNNCITRKFKDYDTLNNDFFSISNSYGEMLYEGEFSITVKRIKEAFRFLHIKSASQIQFMRIDNVDDISGLVNGLIFEDKFPKKNYYIWEDIHECYIFSNDKEEDSFAIIIDSNIEDLITDNIEDVSTILHNKKGYFHKSFCLINLKEGDNGFQEYHTFNIYSDSGDCLICMYLLSDLNQDYNRLEKFFYFLMDKGKFNENDEMDEVDFLEILPIDNTYRNCIYQDKKN